jgi:phenylpyruvate tautomerase PptA (4-oxalocrotonate tautomerase family)
MHTGPATSGRRLPGPRRLEIGPLGRLGTQRGGHLAVQRHEVLLAGVEHAVEGVRPGEMCAGIVRSPVMTTPSGPGTAYWRMRTWERCAGVHDRACARAAAVADRRSVEGDNPGGDVARRSRPAPGEGGERADQRICADLAEERRAVVPVDRVRSSVRSEGARHRVRMESAVWGVNGCSWLRCHPARAAGAPIEAVAPRESRTTHTPRHDDHARHPGAELSAEQKQGLARGLIDAFAEIDRGHSSPQIRAGFVVHIEQVEAGDLWMGDRPMTDASPSGRAAIISTRVMAGPWNRAMKAALFERLEAVVREIADMPDASAGADIWQTLVEVPEGGWGLGGRSVSIERLAPAFADDRQARIRAYLESNQAD